MPDLKYVTGVVEKKPDGTFSRVPFFDSDKWTLEEKKAIAENWMREARTQGKDTKYVVVRRLVSEWEEV